MRLIPLRILFQVGWDPLLSRIALAVIACSQEAASNDFQMKQPYGLSLESDLQNPPIMTFFEACGLICRHEYLAMASFALVSP